jgi:hypothetical protein
MANSPKDIALANDCLRGLAGGHFISCLIGFELQLHILVGSATSVISATKFTLVDSTGSACIDVENDASSAAPLLALIPKATVHSITVSTDGDLRIQFDSGHMCSISPEDNYESWQISGEEGLLMVCMPGGELAIFEPA